MGIKNWDTLTINSATALASRTIPDCAAFLIKHNPVASGGRTGTVTVTNSYNGKSFTVAEGQVISINPQMQTRGGTVVVTGDSVAEVIYWL